MKIYVWLWFIYLVPTHFIWREPTIRVDPDQIFTASALLTNPVSVDLWVQLNYQSTVHGLGFFVSCRGWTLPFLRVVSLQARFVLRHSRQMTNHQSWCWKNWKTARMVDLSVSPLMDIHVLVQKRWCFVDANQMLSILLQSPHSSNLSCWLGLEQFYSILFVPATHGIAIL